MENKKKTRNPEAQNHIPDIHIIDLEGDPASQNTGPTEFSDESGNEAKEKKKGFLSHMNLHVVLLAVTLIFVACIVYKFLTFGKLVDLDEIFKDGPGTYEDNFDSIMPFFDSNDQPVYKNYGQGDTILVFGNAPFADDRNSKDNLANMVQDITGATVYNCSISGSYLAADLEDLDASQAPWDIFCFYWLIDLATKFHDHIGAEFLEGVELLGDSAPSEAMDVYNTLTTIDMNTVDVVIAMYDASDYLAGHPSYSDTNAIDVTQFTGNMEAGIELLHFCYPHIRVIIMSPPYAFALNDDGSYISSDIKRYGRDILSTYVIKQFASCVSWNVTFVDNLYGTINQDDAPEYLTDHLHLNIEGRKKIAERLIYALNYFGNMETPVSTSGE